MRYIALVSYHKKHTKKVAKHQYAQQEYNNYEKDVVINLETTATISLENGVLVFPVREDCQILY
jgi:hypothetical protein